MCIYFLILILVSNSLTVVSNLSILYSRSLSNLLLNVIIMSIIGYNVVFFNTGIGLYGGLFFMSSITNFFHIFIILLTIIILMFNSYYYSLSETRDESDLFKILEYPLIILFIIIGALFLTCSSDLVSLFISIELQSYGLYLLCALYRNSESATAGSLMYFLLGGLSSCFILLGIGILYANSGTTSLDNIYVINSISALSYTSTEHTAPQYTNVDYVYNIFSVYDSYYIIISLVIMGTGFLFKVAAAPFHFWSPDVYDSIPTIVTTFVAIIAKISIFIFLLELVHYLSKSSFDYIWTNNLLISSLLSLIIGTVLGLNQSRVKRLYAYSTISHVGFILLALSIHTIESIQAFLFYIIQYSISNLNAFIILITIGLTSFYSAENLYNYAGIKSKLYDKNYSPIQLINQLKGYFQLNPFLSVSLSITLFSFAGIPPLMGFFGKMMILSAAIDSGYIFMSFIAILTSVIGACYYLYIIKQICFYDFHASDHFPTNQSTAAQYVNKELVLVNVIVANSSEKNHVQEYEDQDETRTTHLKNSYIYIPEYLSIIISILTLYIICMFIGNIELFNVNTILTLILFKL